MTKNEKSIIELSENERVLLHDALVILSPDDPKASERLEILVQSVFGTVAISADLEMEFTDDQMKLAIAALDIINPDEDEAQILAEELVDRFRALYSVDDDISNAVANVDSFA